MLLLRKITEAGLQTNFIIGMKYGDYYNFVTRQFSPEEFSEMAKSQGFDEKAYGFISCANGSIILPLYEGQKNFIVANGKTIDNISFR